MMPFGIPDHVIRAALIVERINHFWLFRQITFQREGKDATFNWAAATVAGTPQNKRLGKSTAMQPGSSRGALGCQ
jgi:hypothetical protein